MIPTPLRLSVMPGAIATVAIPKQFDRPGECACRWLRNEREYMWSGPVHTFPTFFTFIDGEVGSIGRYSYFG